MKKSRQRSKSGQPKRSERLKGIYPDAMYPVETFFEYSGLNREREREARRHGVTLNRVRVGRRVYIRGADGIDYIEALAKLTERLARAAEVAEA